MNKRILLVIVFFLTGCSGTVPNLGVENSQLKPCPESPNCVSSQASDQAHLVEPIVIEKSSIDANNAITKIINELDNSTIVVNEARYIRAEFVSTLFRFVDDVEFYIPEPSAKPQVIHVRSASRVGYSDFGVNRDRVELIRLKLSASHLTRT